MKQFTAVCGVLAATAGLASAGGVDRSGQPIGVLFEAGNYFELGYGQIRPKVKGVYSSTGQPTGNMMKNYDLPSVTLKYQFNDQLSGMITYDNAYGADVAYGGSFAAFQPLAGTTAELNSDNFMGLLRYKFDDNWSVHGGIRASRAGGQITIHRLVPDNAASFTNPLYSAKLQDDWGYGYVIGGAYELPDIAGRAAITYFSEVDHTMKTGEGGLIAEMLAGAPGLNSPTKVTTPQAVNIDLQSGIAADTLAFFQFRWADWSSFRITPYGAGVTNWPNGFAEFNDSYTYTLGIGRKLNENWTGSIFVTYEDAGDNRTTSLSPFSGYKGIGAGLIYTQDNMKITAGARYMKLGNAEAFSNGVKIGDYSGNHAVAAQVKVGFSF